MTVPLGVESGTVMWRVLAASQDTNDADRQPNFGSFRGAVLFTPSRSSIRRLGTPPELDYTIFLDPVLGNVGDDGILRDLSGLEGVVLVSPYSTGIEETGWDWEASFQLNQREKVSLPFRFLPGETVDLSRETPVVSSPGVVMTKGDTGTIAIGTVTTGPAGGEADVDDVGTPGSAILNFVIPRGSTPLVAGVSATSMAIGTGSKVFTTTAGIDAFVVGQFVRVVSRANGANYMAGSITAYSGTSLTINVTETGGSGTFTDWNIALSGVKGNTGNTGAVPVISGTSATSFTPSAGSKVFTTQAGVQGFTVGQFVRIASAAAPTEYMGGAITAYTTTSLTVNVTEWSGSTARTDWQISLSGRQGNTGNTGPSGTITSATASGLGVGVAPTVTLGGTPEARTMAFGIPVGATGATGPGFTWRGPWTAATAYAFRDVVTANGSVFMVNTPHTSGTTAPTWQAPPAELTVWARQGDQGPVGAGAPDATTSAKGSVMLAGDLGGTADAPTVNATAAATPSAIARRDVNGYLHVVGMEVSQDPGGPTNVARRSWVETQDRWTPSFKTGAAYTFVLADEFDHVLANDTVAQTYTIPTNATAAFPLGAKIQLTRWNTGTLTIAGASGVTLNAVNATRTVNQYESCLLLKVATDSWLIVDLGVAGTESVAGMLELATDAETIAGTDAVRATHPRGTLAAIRSVARWVPSFKTANYTFVLADEMNHILSDGATNVTFTVPTNATAAFAIGSRVQVTRWGTGTLTLAPATGVTIQGTSGVRVLNQYESLTLVKTHTDTWLIVDMSVSATETNAGTVELATAAEVTAGTDTSRAVTPAGLKVELDKKVQAVTTGAKLWIGTQAAYDAITTKDATTLYVVT